MEYPSELLETLETLSLFIFITLAFYPLLRLTKLESPDLALETFMSELHESDIVFNPRRLIFGAPFIFFFTSISISLSYLSISLPIAEVIETLSLILSISLNYESYIVSFFPIG